jgi:hypothetical protein
MSDDLYNVFLESFHESISMHNDFYENLTNLENRIVENLEIFNRTQTQEQPIQNNYARYLEFLSGFTEETLMSEILETLNGEAYTNLLTQTFEDVLVTLSENEFEQLEHRPLNEISENLCNICMDNLSNTVTMLQCSHTYHTCCLKQWLCNHNISCPVCRYDVREEIE